MESELPSDVDLGIIPRPVQLGNGCQIYSTGNYLRTLVRMTEVPGLTDISGAKLCPGLLGEPELTLWVGFLDV